MAQTFSKKERLCSVTAIGDLLSEGKFCTAPGMRCRYVRRDGDEGPTRILISVPKKLFRRAVKRNLFKRRIRESYRRLKDGINGGPYDILFIYSTKEELDYARIYESVEAVLEQLH